MRKQNSFVLKRLFYSFLSLFLILVFGMLFFYGDRSENQRIKASQIISIPSKSKPSNSSEDKTSVLHELVRDTISLAKEGKVVNSPFIAGKTRKKEVTNQWGNPNQTTKTSSGLYEEYEKHHVVVGYTGEIVNDIRSYDSNLQAISLNEIKKLSGEPDEVRYFRDQYNNQIILVYHVNSTTDLKWVLPMPDNQNINPKVDHISVYTHIENQAFPQKSVAEIISEMSLDEKIGQMIIASISGTTEDPNTKNLISKYKVGGIIFYSKNLVTPQQSINLLNQLKFENLRNRLPLFLSVDQEGGRVTRLPGLVNFPTNKEIGMINNSQFSYKVGTILGKELKEFGFNLDFAPVLDVNSNPKNPIIGDRSFGTNPDIVSNLGIQTMKGIQSQNIITTIKHFPGHGDTSVDSHPQVPIVNKNLTQLKKFGHPS